MKECTEGFLMGSLEGSSHCAEGDVKPEKNEVAYDFPGNVGSVQNDKPNSRAGSWMGEEHQGFTVPKDVADLNENAETHSKESPWRGRQPVPISRLPLEKLQGTVTQYDNYLYESEGVEDEEEEEEEEDELDSQSSSVTESPIAKDERALRVELQRIYALQLRRERCLSGTLVGSNDFFTPRSGVLTPRSSTSGTPFHSSSERSIFLLNNTSYLLKRKIGPKEAPLPDSLRRQYTKEFLDIDFSGFTTDRSSIDWIAKGPLERKLLEQGITPVYDPKFFENQKHVYRQVLPDLSDLRSFLVQPCAKDGGYIQCHIRRVFSTYKRNSRYKLYLTEKERFLLSARNSKKSRKSNHIISLDEDDISDKTCNYFGNVSKVHKLSLTLTLDLKEI